MVKNLILTPYMVDMVKNAMMSFMVKMAFVNFIYGKKLLIMTSCVFKSVCLKILFGVLFVGKTCNGTEKLKNPKK